MTEVRLKPDAPTEPDPGSWFAHHAIEVAPHCCTVLVVDDDPEVREVLSAWLSADGYRVRTARDGRDALNRLRSTPETCVIVLDLQMPSMDGARFRDAQLRDRSLAWIPVVVMSATLDGARTARELGARGFVRKPCDVERVREIVRQIGCARRPRGPTGPERNSLPGADAHG